MGQRAPGRGQGLQPAVTSSLSLLGQVAFLSDLSFPTQGTVVLDEKAQCDCQLMVVLWSPKHICGSDGPIMQRGENLDSELPWGWEETLEGVGRRGGDATP